MFNVSCRPGMIMFLLCPTLFLAARARGDAQIWSSGPNDLTFSKAAFADTTLPENQDQITPNVALTRDQVQGMYNAAQESFFSRHSSPLDTEWAFSGIGNPTFTYGQGASGVSTLGLTFTDWEDSLGATGNLQGNIVNRPGVLYLVTDNIYIDIEFTAWGGSGTGGAFTYIRAVNPVVAGDINGNGVIDMDDYLAIDNGFLNHLTGAANGDFNNDNVVNAADYAIIDASYAAEHPEPALATTLVPEPGSLIMLLAGVFPLVRGRRRRGQNV